MEKLLSIKMMRTLGVSNFQNIIWRFQEEIGLNAQHQQGEKNQKWGIIQVGVTTPIQLEQLLLDH